MSTNYFRLTESFLGAIFGRVSERGETSFYATKEMRAVMRDICGRMNVPPKTALTWALTALQNYILAYDGTPPMPPDFVAAVQQRLFVLRERAQPIEDSSARKDKKSEAGH